LYAGPATTYDLKDHVAGRSKLTKPFKTMGEFKRAVAQGAVSIIHPVSREVFKVTSTKMILDGEEGASVIIKYGKGKFLRIDFV